MKLQVFTVLALVIGAYALPRASDVVVVAEPSDEPTPRNIVVEIQIRNIIETISNIIKWTGLDPLEVKRNEIDINSSSLDLALKAFVENLKFSGASNIQIHTLNYNTLFSRLRLDISLPEISLEIGASGFEANVFGEVFEGQLKGSLIIKSIRLATEVNVNVGIGGVYLRSLQVNASLGGILSDVTAVVQGRDISDEVNDLLAHRLPLYLRRNRDNINRKLEDNIRDFLNRMWSL